MTFIAKAKEIHGDKYNYDKTTYTRTIDKVTITCPEHGDFKIAARAHLVGQGCATCGKESSARSRSLTVQEFRNKAAEVHGDLYDFGPAVYTTARERVNFICPEHGLVSARATRILKGAGCPKCGVRNRGPKSAPTNLKTVNQEKASGFDGRVFLEEFEWRTYLRRMPVRYITRKRDTTCCVCGKAQNLQHSHQIGFKIGVTKLGLTPDWLDGSHNIVTACRGACNDSCELTEEQAKQRLKDLGFSLPSFLENQP